MRVDIREVALLMFIRCSLSLRFFAGIPNGFRFRRQRYGGVVTEILRPSSQASTALAAASRTSQFDVGDRVTIVSDDGSDQRGVVEQKRGGWYTICLAESPSAIRIKRRGAQMLAEAAPGSDEAMLTKVDATPAEILDLDSVLRDGHEQQDLDIDVPFADETIQQAMMCHSKCRKWLVFSDLHVMPSTLSTCIQVLNEVHATAQRLDAGILFLGDFWHHRGVVRVDCLNAVLKAMSTWTSPCMMIPGNHDQVSWSGHEHSLTPLSNAYRIHTNGDTGAQHPGPMIFSHPTKFLDALFVPHIRDKAKMQTILSSEEAIASEALFVHADVRGASMNDLILSQHGISSSNFPPNKLIYSGHFHKPHAITGGASTLRYVGSPYQTSLSECGQQKSLLLLDSQLKWDCVQEIPIDVGPKFYRYDSIEHLVGADVANLRESDVAVVSVDQVELEEMRNHPKVDDPKSNIFDSKVDQLRRTGVSVQIRDSPSKNVSEEKDDCSRESPVMEHDPPRALLERYLDVCLEKGEYGAETAKLILEGGLTLLDRLEETRAEIEEPDSQLPAVDVELDSVTLCGLGPFRQRITYPLGKRGVVLLRGRNKDDESDSNGVGKTNLAFAPLWAITGSADTKPTKDAKVTDVVNDFSRAASVSLRGYLNQKQEFVITRTKSRSSSGSSLRFSVDGQDLTRQSTKDTQQIIDETLLGADASLMARVMFHGQHESGGLLQAPDATFKDELSSLSRGDIWRRSASEARVSLRQCSQRVSELEGMLEMRTGDMQKLSERCDELEGESKHKQALIIEAERSKKNADEKKPGLEDLQEALALVQAQKSSVEDELAMHESKLAQTLDKLDLDSLRDRLAEAKSSQNEAQNTLNDCQREKRTIQTDAKAAEKRSKRAKTKWRSASTQSPESQKCHTCGQPILTEDTRRQYLSQMKKELDDAERLVQNMTESALFIDQACRTAMVSVSKSASLVQSCEEALFAAEEDSRMVNDALSKKIRLCRERQTDLSSQLVSIVQRTNEESKTSLVDSKEEMELIRLRDALYAAKKKHNECVEEQKGLTQEMARIQTEKEDNHEQVMLNKNLVDVFGIKGIQAFILKGLVNDLQQCSQQYLDLLSDGNLQIRICIGDNDSIVKHAAMRSSTDGTWHVRPLSSLSGGQWRRCSLAVDLGYIELAAKRGKLRSSLLVLDEPLNHLDSAGRQCVGTVLRHLLAERPGKHNLTTILVILQEIAADEIGNCFDHLDEVVKCDGASTVHVDENSLLLRN